MLKSFGAACYLFAFWLYRKVMCLHVHPETGFRCKRHRLHFREHLYDSDFEEQLKDEENFVSETRSYLHN